MMKGILPCSCSRCALDDCSQLEEILYLEGNTYVDRYKGRMYAQKGELYRCYDYQQEEGVEQKLHKCSRDLLLVHCEGTADCWAAKDIY